MDIAYGRLYGRRLRSLIWTDVAYMDVAYGRLYGRCLYAYIFGNSVNLRNFQNSVTNYVKFPLIAVISVKHFR